MSDSLSPVGNASGGDVLVPSVQENSGVDLSQNDSRDNALFLDVESRDLGFIESSSVG